MHTEPNAMILNNIQRQPNHLQQAVPIPEQNQQQFSTHFPTTTTENTISLSEGLYVPTPNQHLTSEGFYQCYSDTARPCCPTTSSSSSSSSSSTSSSDDSSYGHSKEYNKSRSSVGVNLRVTGQCSQGGRKYMEDYFSVAYQQSENTKDLEYAFIGIYDGHGGAEAAKFAKEHLMMEIINQKHFWSDDDFDVLRAIRHGYIATHYSMWREQDKWPKTANGLPSTAGTTATVAFIRREKIYIGHVGDSGIVLGYQNEGEDFWRAKQLTVDHKPESVEERTRIMNAGGKVVVKSGVPRVVWNRPRNPHHRDPVRKKILVDEIPFLAVARSLGDLWSYNSERNEFVVSPEPDVRVIPINPDTFRCLIFGTDGLWNVVSAQEAVNTVRDKEVINDRLLAQRGDSPHEGNQWTNPSKSLVEQALRTWSQKKMRADNTSVVTVILYPPANTDQSTEAGCNVANKVPNNPTSSLQHISYGLEYTQVQAEIPTEDDTTTCKDLASKYLPPEHYQNFSYYTDDSDTDDDDDEDTEIAAEKRAERQRQNANCVQQYTTTNNWNWQQNTFAKVGEEVDEEDDEDDENLNKPLEDMVKHKPTAGERQVCVMNYPNYVHMEAEETNNATDSYINTFAESYNSILTSSQNECLAAATSSPSSSLSSNSNSNSNSNCQSVTPPNMHDILQEQQLYQQQCMSEEEGYSLTKLETRREQQICKVPNEATSAVQTFKIFNDAPLPTQQMGMYHTITDRFYQAQSQFMPHISLPKPLELHSLLQQEREEEQQVALERLQMESKLQQQHQQQQQSIETYACLQTTNTMPMPAEEQPMEIEYLQEETSVADTDTLNGYNSSLQQDETVQINEISSSCSETSILKRNCNEPVRTGVEIIEKIEILPNSTIETNTEDESKHLNNETLNEATAEKVISLQTAPVLSKLSLPPLKSNLNHNKRNKTSYLYNNVPNENLQRISTLKYNHSRYTPNAATCNTKRSMCITTTGTITPPAATSTPMIQRQLRSTTTPCATTPNTTPMIEYGKRTLRARNSLTKDMKAKSSLVQATLKYPQNAVTRNFLRTTAANLMVAKPLHINELNITPCSLRSLGNANSVRTQNRNSIKTRREKSSVTLNGSLNQKTNKQNTLPHSQLNLRSRPITSPPSSLASTLSSSNASTTCTLRSPAASTPVIKRASLTERRILRSTLTRSTSSKGSQTPANFSKSTRTQSTGSNLAAPPPSPKLINAVAAVAAATRARSLLNGKHVAIANGTQSVVSNVFGKRSNLRSNDNRPHPAVLPNNSTTTASLTSSVATHQTLRGRIVKKLKR